MFVYGKQNEKSLFKFSFCHVSEKITCMPIQNFYGTLILNFHSWLLATLSDTIFFLLAVSVDDLNSTHFFFFLLPSSIIQTSFLFCQASIFSRYFAHSSSLWRNLLHRITMVAEVHSKKTCNSFFFFTGRKQWCLGLTFFPTRPGFNPTLTRTRFP